MRAMQSPSRHLVQVWSRAVITTVLLLAGFACAPIPPHVPLNDAVEFRDRQYTT